MMKLGIANYYSVLKKNIAEESALTEEVFWNMVGRIAHGMEHLEANTLNPFLIEVKRFSQVALF